MFPKLSSLLFSEFIFHVLFGRYSLCSFMYGQCVQVLIFHAFPRSSSLCSPVRFHVFICNAFCVPKCNVSCARTLKVQFSSGAGSKTCPSGSLFVFGWSLRHSCNTLRSSSFFLFSSFVLFLFILYILRQNSSIFQRIFRRK